MKPKCVLVIGGSDCSGGAGIQIDLKVLQHFGVLGASAITAVTAQNPQQFFSWSPVNSNLLLEQLWAVENYFEIKVVKIGMIGTAENIHAISQFLCSKNYFVILDPVLKASTGSELHIENFLTNLPELFPQVSLLTPNRIEAEKICKNSTCNQEDLLEKLAQETHISWIILKGGHYEGEKSIDILRNPEGKLLKIHKDRIPQKEFHGTGCTFASAIAAKLFLGKSLEQAFIETKDWLYDQMRKSKNQLVLSR